ncbi:MAG: methionyl-tRNA formyltransferase [Eubacteriales bacterium]|nr:methionyl-tRNA formyltransferase [Clostridia bacterium]MDY2844643.1 methionyl-tRNA formyltransferase [Eubacteriales bacterium]
MKILFMGTPDLAAVCLEAVYNKAGVEVVGVLTQPDKPKGRGMKLVPPPVKVFAEEHGIPVYQPQTLKNGAFEDELKKLDPDMIIVAAYGKILPKYVLDYPKYGCVNAHGSILPKYRGASPIQRAIIDGEKVTGITAMYMAEGLDTGDIIKIYPCDITPDDDFGSLHDKLANLAGVAMCDVIDMTENGTITRTKQDDEKSSYAAKIEKEDTVIDFTKNAEDIVNLVRGLSPAPLAVTRTPDGKLLKLTHARLSDMAKTDNAGEVAALSDKGEGEIVLSCGDGCISVTGVVPEGKKPMKSADYIRGRRISVGDILKY